MAKKKKLPDEAEVEDVPTGKVDDDGDEILDLYDEKDNLEEDLDYDLSEIDDEIQDHELDSEYLPIRHQIYDDEYGHEIHVFNATSEDGIFSIQFYVVANISRVYREVIVTSEIKLDLAN